MSSSYFDPAVAAFVIIPALLLVAFVWGTFAASRRSGAASSTAAWTSILAGVASAVWMALTWVAARAGILHQWDRVPPPFGVLMIIVVALAVFVTFSAAGRNISTFLPLWVLVAIQAFRLPLEIAMHAMYERGIMPGQMSYSGRNFDILTGGSAIVVAALAARGRAGRKIVAAWNVLGMALLINVVTVAVLSKPTFRYFGDGQLNVWVTDPPFVWLPAVMVLAALMGHLLIFRALRWEGRAGKNEASPSELTQCFHRGDVRGSAGGQPRRDQRRQG
jgi:hypothetical protein